MKVAVRIVVDVDPQAYRDEYGTDDTLDEIREDIRYRVQDSAETVLRGFFYTKSVELR